MTQPGLNVHRHEPTPEEFVAAQQSEDFQKLRSTMRKFTFPMTVIFLVWFLLYVILAMYAPGFMGIRVWGNINIGVILGFGQFVTTFLITYLYVQYSNTKIEPLANKVREDLENLPDAPSAAAGA